jgi:hypothetical protein
MLEERAKDEQKRHRVPERHDFAQDASETR